MGKGTGVFMPRTMEDVAGLRASLSSPSEAASSDKPKGSAQRSKQKTLNVSTGISAAPVAARSFGPPVPVPASAGSATGSSSAAAACAAPPRPHPGATPRSGYNRSCTGALVPPLQRLSPVARSNQSAAFAGCSSPTLLSCASSPAGATYSGVLLTTASSCFSSQQLFTAYSQAQLMCGAAAFMPDALLHSWDELAEPLGPVRQGSSSFCSSNLTPSVSQVLWAPASCPADAAPAGAIASAAAATTATAYLPQGTQSNSLLALAPWSPPSTGCEGWEASTACYPTDRLFPICSGPVLPLSPAASYQEQDPQAALNTLLQLRAKLAAARAGAVSAGEVVQPAVDVSAALLGGSSCDSLLSSGLDAPYGQQQRQQQGAPSGPVVLGSPSNALIAAPAGSMFGTWPGGALVGQLLPSTDGFKLISNFTGVDQQLVCLPAPTNSMEPQQQLQLCGGQQVVGDTVAAAAAAVAQAKLATLQQLEVLQQQLRSNVVTLLPLL